MLHANLARVTAIALMLGLLPGCNAQLAATTAANVAASPNGGFLFGPRTDTTQGGGMGMGGPQDLGQIVSALALTDAQKTQVAAIALQYPAQTPAAQPVDGASALLTADTIDETALQTAIAAQLAARAGSSTTEAARDEAYYAVLTADQRTSVATSLSANAGGMGAPGGTPPSGAPTGAMPSGMPSGGPGGTPPSGAPGGMGGPGGQVDVSTLNLTTAQKAAYDAFEAKLTTGGQLGGGNNAAIAAYFTSGDKTTFEAALKAGATYPTDELVALAQALTAAQRKTLFANGLPGLGGGPGGMPGGAPAPAAS